MATPVELMTSWPPETYLPEALKLGKKKCHEQVINHIWHEVIAPIVNSEDLYETFRAKREEYERQRETRSSEEHDIGHLLNEEDRGEEMLKIVLMWHEEQLGKRALKATMGGIDLRRIIRRATIPHNETWPPHSWERMSHLMAGNELCNLAIVYHLATRQGDRETIETLATWGFQYAMEAYQDAGYYGQDSTKMEEMPA